MKATAEDAKLDNEENEEGGADEEKPAADEDD